MSTISQLHDAIKDHCSLEDDDIRQAGEHGADAGWGGFTYYSETCEFFANNRDLIIALANEQSEEFGLDVVSFVAGFNCLTDDHETRNEIARALYSPISEVEDTQIPNALAWYALEEVGRYLDYVAESCDQ